MGLLDFVFGPETNEEERIFEELKAEGELFYARAVREGEEFYNKHK